MQTKTNLSTRLISGFSALATVAFFTSLGMAIASSSIDKAFTSKSKDTNK